MPTEIDGLPAHVLLVHVIVVLAPLGALFTVLSAIWPTARRKLGIVSPATCALVVVFTPITTNAGDWLRRKLESAGANPAIDKHAALGHDVLWFVAGLFVVSAAVWWLGRSADRAAAPDRPGLPASGGTATLTRDTTTNLTWVTYAVAVVAVAVAALVVWQVYRVGDSGARAAWDYVHKLK